MPADVGEDKGGRDLQAQGAEEDTAMEDTAAATEEGSTVAAMEEDSNTAAGVTVEDLDMVVEPRMVAVLQTNSSAVAVPTTTVGLVVQARKIQYTHHSLRNQLLLQLAL